MPELKPWQKLPKETCAHCGRPATYQARGAAGALLSCQAHSDEVMDEAFRADGWADGAPLRQSWKFYLLYHRYPGRLIGDGIIAAHNWRMERRARRAQACSHVWDGERCASCGARSLGVDEDGMRLIMLSGG